VLLVSILCELARLARLLHPSSLVFELEVQLVPFGCIEKATFCVLTCAVGNARFPTEELPE
jgi:hypothetical protein